MSKKELRIKSSSLAAAYQEKNGISKADFHKRFDDDLKRIVSRANSSVKNKRNGSTPLQDK